MYLQSASRRYQREAALVLGEVPTEVAPEEERAQELMLRAVEGETRHRRHVSGPVRARNSEYSSAFTHTPTQGSIDKTNPF